MADITEVQIDESIRPYLDEIADRLWSGHAAVLVGAGFSRNATPSGTTDLKFPDSAALGDLFYEKTHGHKPKKDEHYLNTLKLADELQAAWGRPVLDQLLISNIPNKDYEPSPLHVKLLELPWTDVFTTNYDTLLERAADFITSRKYDVVEYPEDLVYSKRPRIIKLHGSFPSEGPFVITEEDYRRYPQKFALFVNTVQQALLENTLCLIGSSGDDPNFLQWIGWIRDNLDSEKLPKIYLAGISDLTDAQKKLLAQRNIVLVDLAGWHNVGKNRYKALKAFCDYLHDKRDHSGLEWPGPQEKSFPERDHSGLEWPGQQKKLFPDRNNQDRITQLKEVLAEWRKARVSYPGWCIVPEDRRTSIWTFTNKWLNFILKLDGLRAPLDLECAYELNWRLEKCLCPLPNNLAEFFENILQRYNPFEEEISSTTSPITPSTDSGRSLAWDEIRRQWLYLLLSMLRFYREEGLRSKWQDANNKLDGLYPYLPPSQKAHLHYERVMAALFALDLPEIKNQLTRWPANESLPFWEAKRAGLLAEIGQIEEAEKILEQSLQNIRSKLNLKPVTTDYSLVSQEAYAMILLKRVKDIRRFLSSSSKASPEEETRIRELFEAELKPKKEPDRNSDSRIRKDEKTPDFDTAWKALCRNRDESRKSEWNLYLMKVRSEKFDKLEQKFRDRWNALKKYKCDPWNELKLFENYLERDPAVSLEITEKKGFDIGYVTRTHHIAGEGKEALSAYAFLRFCEDVGIPFKISNFALATQSATGTLSRISKYSFYWALATMIRIGDAKVVNNIFNRESLHKLDVAFVDNLIDKYLRAIERSLSELQSGDSFRVDDYGILPAQIIPEILSRLCCKCSLEAKKKLLDFLLGVYKSDQKSKYCGINNLTRRLLESFSEREQYEEIPKLLMFPNLRNLYHPNPFIFLHFDKTATANWKKLDLAETCIEALFEQADSNNSYQRQWAIFTIVQLHRFGLLREDLVAKLGEVLWAQRDASGFPAHTSYYTFVFLDLPHPDEVDTISLFKKYVQDTPFPIHKNKSDSGVAMTGGNVPICREIVGASKIIQWTEQEIISIFNRLLKWWDADKEFLKKDERPSPFGSTIPQEFRARFSRLVDVLVKVVAPALGQNSDSKEKDAARRLLSELKEFGAPSLYVEAACLHIFPDNTREIIPRINDALASNERETVSDGLWAIIVFIQKQQHLLNEPELSILLNKLGQMVRWRRKTGLRPTLNTVAMLIEEQPSYFTGDLEGLTQKGLQDIAVDTDYDAGNADWDFAEKLEIRQAAASLAYVIFQHYSNLGKPIPDAIEKWKDICCSEDEFAEIRNQWLTI